MANRSDYALPFALLTVGGLLTYSGFKGKNLLSVFSGDIGKTLDPAGGSAPVDISGGDQSDPSGGGSAGGGGSPASTGALAYPLGSKGKIIGTPGAGTHSYSAAPNNWQSDKAIDISVPTGTDVFAVDDGRIVRLGGAWAGLNTGPIGGLNVTIKSANNQWFYTHLMSRAGLRVGQIVTKGQLIGKSGGANGVAHLHLGSEDVAGVNAIAAMA